MTSRCLGQFVGSQRERMRRDDDASLEQPRSRWPDHRTQARRLRPGVVEACKRHPRRVTACDSPAGRKQLRRRELLQLLAAVCVTSSWPAVVLQPLARRPFGDARTTLRPYAAPLQRRRTIWTCSPPASERWEAETSTQAARLSSIRQCLRNMP